MEPSANTESVINSSLKPKPKPLTIILVIAAVILAAAAGFFIWQYFNQKSEIYHLNQQIDDMRSQINNLQKQPSDQEDSPNTDISKDKSNNGTSDNKPSTTNPPKEEYLTIKEWGIRFKIPAELIGEVQYAPFDSSTDSFGFSTKTLTSRGGAYCNAEEGTLGLIARSVNKVGGEDAWDLNDNTRLNSAPIANHYYFYITPHAACSTNKDINSLASSLFPKIEIMLASIQKSP